MRSMSARVAALERRFRPVVVREPSRDVAVVGEDQQTETVLVQSADGIYALRAGVLHQIHHGLVGMGILQRGHVALGLVEHVGAMEGGGQDHPCQHDLVPLRIHLPPRILFRHTVDPDAAPAQQLLDLLPGIGAVICNTFVKPHICTPSGVN